MTKHRFDDFRNTLDEVVGIKNGSYPEDIDHDNILDYEKLSKELNYGHSFGATPRVPATAALSTRNKPMACQESLRPDGTSRAVNSSVFHARAQTFDS